MFSSYATLSHLFSGKDQEATKINIPRLHPICFCKEQKKALSRLVRWLALDRMIPPRTIRLVFGGSIAMNTLAVVEEVLRETATPMTVKQIVQRAGARLPSKSKTPDTVVARDLSVNIKKLGEQSLFVRTAPGLYTLRAFLSIPAPIADAPVSVVTAALRHERSGPTASPMTKKPEREDSALSVLSGVS